jgi:hypothetical protein
VKEEATVYLPTRIVIHNCQVLDNLLIRTGGHLIVI